MPINRKFRKRVRQALANKPLRSALDNFAHSYPGDREKAYEGIDFQQLREEITAVKSYAVDNYRQLANQFEAQLSQRGGHVHRAEDGKQVAAIIRDIANRATGSSRRHRDAVAVKSKSMATEEIGLNQQLEDVLRVVETDLGEWIIQQIDEKPSHMVMPAIHLTKEKCAQIFSDFTGRTIEQDIPHMVKLARGTLREEFLAAHIGITGCNIAVAETGTMVLFTNEGNARLTTTLPPVHIVVMGYEKLVAQFKDIAPLAAAIPRSATAQAITSYITMISAPCESFKSPAEQQVVSKELHVILMDNGRQALLEDENFKQVAHCVRCASCLNVCPVYQLVGGQVYGDVYSGGIGSLLSGFFGSYKQTEKFQELCIACGKCNEYCPASIDIPATILDLRSRIREEIPPPFLHKLVLNHVLPHNKLLEFSVKAASPAMRVLDRFPNPAPVPFRKMFDDLKQVVPVVDRKGTICLFYGCMIDYIYPEIGEAVVSLLNGVGYRVIAPDQSCCGAPSYFSGLSLAGEGMAADNLEKWGRHTSAYKYIVTACPTCSFTIKKKWSTVPKDKDRSGLVEKIGSKTLDLIHLWYLLQKENPEIMDSSQFSKQRPVTVTYHDSCHLKNELGIYKEPRDIISSLPGVEFIEMEEADRCCGFGGTYSIKLPEISEELTRQKSENIKKSKVDYVLTDCPGCLMTIRAGLKKSKSKVKAMHTAVFLAQRFLL